MNNTQLNIGGVSRKDTRFLVSHLTTKQVLTIAQKRDLLGFIDKVIKQDGKPVEDQTVISPGNMNKALNLLALKHTDIHKPTVVESLNREDAKLKEETLAELKRSGDLDLSEYLPANEIDDLERLQADLHEVLGDELEEAKHEKREPDLFAAVKSLSENNPNLRSELIVIENSNFYFEQNPNNALGASYCSEKRIIDYLEHLKSLDTLSEAQQAAFDELNPEVAKDEKGGYKDTNKMFVVYGKRLGDSSDIHEILHGLSVAYGLHGNKSTCESYPLAHEPRKGVGEENHQFMSWNHLYSDMGFAGVFDDLENGLERIADFAYPPHISISALRSFVDSIINPEAGLDSGFDTKVKSKHERFDQPEEYRKECEKGLAEIARLVKENKIDLEQVMKTKITAVNKAFKEKAAYVSESKARILDEIVVDKLMSGALAKGLLPDLNLRYAQNHNYNDSYSYQVPYGKFWRQAMNSLVT